MEGRSHRVTQLGGGRSDARRCLDCGASLRRTNAGSRCAACTARLSGAHPIPQHFWYADDVAEALAQWDLPAVVQIIHRKLGLTQVALANLTGYSQAHIGRWLRRDGNPEGVTALRLRQFVEGLAIPWELLGLIDPAARESSSQVRRGSFGNDGVAEEDHQAMKRRTFVVSSTFAAGLAAFAPEGLSAWHGQLGV